MIHNDFILKSKSVGSWNIIRATFSKAQRNLMKCVNILLFTELKKHSKLVILGIIFSVEKFNIMLFELVALAILMKILTVMCYGKILSAWT